MEQNNPTKLNLDKDIVSNNENSSEDLLYGGITQEELERLKSKRRERYTNGEQYYKADQSKKVSKKVVIGSIIIVFAYYIALFTLDITGTISKMMMLLLSCAGVGIAAALYYFLVKRRNR